VNKEIITEAYPAVRQMSDEQRVGIVRDIFSSISGKYDFLNRFLSLRQDLLWRRRAVREMRFFRTNRFLDVATGTGDLAIDCAKAFVEASVTGVDFVPEMIDAGQKKLIAASLQERVDLRHGDATALEFDDNSFDVAAIAFGIRNTPDRKRVLVEMRRVVVESGMVMVLELSTPEPGVRRSIYSFYLNRVLPKVAKLFTKNAAAYEYLADSIMNFPVRSEFLEIMMDVGLVSCRAIPLTFGICTLYIGEKA